jgi:light-regulated signal transduction histidine kinase (bacteriophytochrome)
LSDNLALRLRRLGLTRPLARREKLLLTTLGHALEALKHRDERRRAEAELDRLNASLELRVRERTLQLEAANRELEAFSYSVSHDLRSPLRAINGFSRVLHEEHAGRLDAEGTRLLEMIQANARDMGQLIDDLLAFSRAGRQELKRTRVTMRSLVEEVFRGASAGAGKEVRLELGELPDAFADPALLRQVRVNLLSNAVKFSAPNEAPLVGVCGRVERGETVYEVRDNGVGFDMKYANKLFGVFQRLHSSRDFEGTGVGLALVQRIVSRHGGRVWAEAEPGRGACFGFALPTEVAP